MNGSLIPDTLQSVVPHTACGQEASEGVFKSFFLSFMEGNPDFVIPDALEKGIL